MKSIQESTFLVTGGAGFIGCALSQMMSSAAGRWVVFDSMHPQVHKTPGRPEGLHKQAELIIGDVTQPEDWDRLLGIVSPNIVIHLAAETGTAQSLHEASRHSLVNVVGTTQMLDALGRHKVSIDHLILSSSRAIYGEGRWQQDDGSIYYPGMRPNKQLESASWDFENSTPLASCAANTEPRPTSVYGATKLAQEQIIKAWAGAHSVDTTILRLQNVYGPGQSLINSYTGIVSLFSQWAEAHKTIPVYEDGQIMRDFVYIDDVARAFVSICSEGRVSGSRTFDVGSGHGTTIMDLARIVAEYYDAPSPIVTGAYRDGDVRSASCDVGDTVNQIDWKPRVSLVEGLSLLQSWISSRSERTD